MRPCLLGCAVLCIALIVAGSRLRMSAAGPVDDGTRERLVELATALLPREFALDTALRLAAAAPPTETSTLRLTTLYEQAFVSAGDAREPVSRRQLGGLHTDTATGPAAQGHRHGIDTLSLRGRAIEGLISVAPGRALRLAGSLAFTIPELTCSASMVPDPERGYTTLGAVLKHFRSSDGAPTSDTAYLLLEQRFRRFRSSAEIAHLLGTRASATLSPSQTRTTLILLAGRLPSLRDDDLTFSTYLGENWRHVKRTVDVLGSDPLATALLEGFRQYVVTHLSATRCVFTDTPPFGPAPHEAPVMAAISATLERRGIPPLSRAEMTRSGAVRAFLPFDFWQSPPSRTLMRRLKQWRSEGRRLLPASEAALAGVRADLRQLQADMVRWTPADEPTTASWAHQRWSLLMLLLEALPDGSERDGAVTEVVRFAITDGRHYLTDLEWYTRVRHTLARLRSSPGDWSRLLDAIHRSGDRELTLYADVEQVVGEPR